MCDLSGNHAESLFVGQYSGIVNYPTTTVGVSDHYGTTNISIRDAYRGIVFTNASATAGIEFNLPAAAVGMKVTFYNTKAYTITIDPSGTNHIEVVTSTGGDYLQSDGVIGSYITLVCLKATEWQVLEKVGVWTEE
jgi:hypothetical protein